VLIELWFHSGNVQWQQPSDAVHRMAGDALQQTGSTSASFLADTSAMETSVAAAAYRLTQGWRDTPLTVARLIACWRLPSPSPDTLKIVMLSTGPMGQAILQPEQTRRS
jgi:hypothetical protein